jgi:SAM-dependent methyltransferase
MNPTHAIGRIIYGVLPGAMKERLRDAVGGSPRPQWSRVVMNRSTEQFVRSLDPRSLDALEISGDRWKGLPFRSYRSIDFPQYDLCAGPLASQNWDIILLDQVLEHVVSPAKAVRNIWTMLRPGGVFVNTTPFLIPIHEHPIDCSRWTETGIKHFLADNGFPLDGIQTGSWGNRHCLIANLSGRWPAYIPLLHSVKNDPRYPVVVWAFAHKNGAAHP